MKNIGKIDKNVEAVREALKKRSELGFKKYGCNTERTDVDLLGWLQNLQEELMDACIYLERTKSELKGEHEKNDIQ